MKCKKMLGSIQDPTIQEMMKIIETQSKTTLSIWAINYVEKEVMPIFMKRCPNEQRLIDAIIESKNFLMRKCKLSDVKPYLKDATNVARELNDDPISQCCARAVSVACATIQTPTNALGFTFYTLAAKIYSTYGLEESTSFYDLEAQKEVVKILENLKEFAVENEPDPVNIKWGC